MVTTRPPKTIVEPTALGTVANTDSKLLIYRLFQKGRVLAQDAVARARSFFLGDDPRGRFHRDKNVFPSTLSLLLTSSVTTTLFPTLPSATFLFTVAPSTFRISPSLRCPTAFCAAVARLRPLRLEQSAASLQ